MSERVPAAVLVLVLVLVLLAVCMDCTQGPYPRANNVTWKSINFKTLLVWEPKPSVDYSYTVEFSRPGGNQERNPHCIRSSLNMCDLSSSLTDLNACYTADVLSEPPLGATSDLIEFPHTTSPQFCPYTDTDLGRPDFKLKVSEDKKKTTLYVSDPLTALFRDGQHLTLRDVFSEQLRYKVTYRKNQSTGKKVFISESNEVELTALDRGESYCFTVQAFIPTRPRHKQLGEMSETQCSNDDQPSIFKVYSGGVIAGGILLIILLLGVIVAVVVICCRRRRNAMRSGKEGVPLQNV